MENTITVDNGNLFIGTPSLKEKVLRDEFKNCFPSARWDKDKKMWNVGQIEANLIHGFFNAKGIVFSVNPNGVNSSAPVSQGGVMNNQTPKADKIWEHNNDVIVRVKALGEDKNMRDEFKMAFASAKWDSESSYWRIPKNQFSNKANVTAWFIAKGVLFNGNSRNTPDTVTNMPKNQVQIEPGVVELPSHTARALVEALQSGLNNGGIINIKIG